ncbi:hypothetical protein P3T76_008940 [Phytophthora citrophthora]|uniref:Uncharacterized protein n=1 Tax=Phytophthora citrophthora TaxID=4793 RepID=A0AAD9GI60_9STRA|nr:hypothetical protein P3T76_008940 [Phytophthora citrophthora]
MVTSPSEPPPKHVKLRHRALAYVRRIGRHRQPTRPRASSRRSFADTRGARPPVEIDYQRRFSDSDGPRPAVDVTQDGPRPVVRLGSRRSFIESGARNRRSFVDSKGSKPFEQPVYFDSTQAEVKINTQSRRTRRARKKLRKAQGKRQRFLASIHDHGGHRFRLFCSCCIEQEAFNPGDSPSFQWGVGFDDSYYHSPNYQRLSKGTKFRLGLCGLHVTSRREAVDFVDLSSVGAKAASFDSSFDFTCASPVSCPPPLGLVPARELPTTLQLLSRNGAGSEDFTLNTVNGFSSTGFKRKVSSKSSGYPSYIPNTPPSPFMNDLEPTGTFNTTRTRSRVSVGCNGWFMNDNDPAIAGWYHRSSGEIKPIGTKLEQVAEASDSGFDRDTPKRYKRSPSFVGAASGLLSPSGSSPTPLLTPRPKPSSTRVSVVLLSQDGSLSSSNGKREWFENSGIALVPLPVSPIATRSSYSSGLVSQTYDSGLMWHEESSNTKQDDSEPPTKRQRSSDSLSNSSEGFGILAEEVESPHIEKNQSSRENLSLTARFSASLRLTRSHSPRTMRRTLLATRRSSSHSTSQSRRVFRLGSRSTPPPSTPARMGSRPTMIYIDCPP